MKYKIQSYLHRWPEAMLGPFHRTGRKGNVEPLIKYQLYNLFWETQWWLLKKFEVMKYKMKKHEILFFNLIINERIKLIMHCKIFPNIV